MTDNEIIKAWDILCKLDFFNQRAGRELWNDKPEDIQNKDIEDFANDVQFLKDLINRLQAENERLKKGWKADVIETQNIKAEAIKEFAEKVKAQTMFDNAFVDNLVKEMVGEE